MFRSFMKTLILVLFIGCLMLSGCSIWGNSASDNDVTSDKDGTPELEQPQTPTEQSQEKAFTGLRWMLFAGIALAAIGVGLMFVPIPILKTWALGCVASGGLMSFMAITLNQHYVLISWIGLGLGLAGIGLLSLMLWKNKDKLEAAGVALFEVVTGNDLAKRILPEDLKQKLYGASNVLHDKGLVGDVQSPATEKLVAKIRDSK